MIIYYEEFPDPNITKTIISVVLSSNGVTTTILKQNKQEDAIKNLCLNLFKQVELKNRDFNEQTFVWSFIGYAGKVIINQLESMCLQGLFPSSKVKKIEDLEQKARDGNLSYIKPIPKEKLFDPSEFYYNPKDSGTEALSGSALAARLAPLLAIPVEELIKSTDDSKLKKTYRQAALRLHPDRNNGDGSKMSELNMLWNIYMNKGA